MHRCVHVLLSHALNPAGNIGGQVKVYVTKRVGDGAI